MLKNERLTKDGREILDPTPINIPVGYRQPETLEQKIARMVAIERLSQESAANGGETFEESLDFDVGDDIDPTTPWEVLADREDQLLEDLKLLRIAKKRVERVKKKKEAKPDAKPASDASKPGSDSGPSKA